MSQCVADLEDVLIQEKKQSNLIYSNINFEIKVDEDENITVDHSLKNSVSVSRKNSGAIRQEIQVMSKTANLDPNEAQRWSMANINTLESNRDFSAGR